MWDTCLSKETYERQPLYGIRNSKTGQTFDMAETMGIAQMYANAYNVRDGYREAPTSIVADKIPDNWDGIELRRMLAERFQRQVIGTMSRSRKSEYENTILVNDL